MLYFKEKLQKTEISCLGYPGKRSLFSLRKQRFLAIAIAAKLRPQQKRYL